MNLTAILFLLAFFCISFAHGHPPDLKLRCQIKEAYFEKNWTGQPTTTQTFNTGKVFLFELTDKNVTANRGRRQLYKIGNNSGVYSHQFILDKFTAIVSEDNFTIFTYPTIITISTMDGKNFGFYQDLFPSLGSYSKTFPVTKIFQGMTTVWDRKHVIEAYEFKSQDDWVFVVRDDGKSPKRRLIFPGYGVKSVTKSCDTDVAIVLRTRNATPTTIEFANSTVADEFYKLVKPLIKIK